MSDDATPIFTFFAGVVLGFVFAMFFVVAVGLTREDGIKHERSAAVEAGVAEYIVNPKTGETAFTYKEPAK